MSDGLVTKIIDEAEVVRQIKLMTDGLDAVAARMEKIAEMAAKNPGTFSAAKNMTDVKKATDDLTATQKQAEAQQKELARIQAQAATMESDLAKKILAEKAALDEKRKAQKLDFEATDKSVGAYRNLVAQVKIAEKEYRDIAAAQGMNSKATQDALAKLNGLNTQLNTINRSMGNWRDNVGNYQSAFDRIKGAWLGITAAWTAATVALGGVVAFMKSSIQAAVEDERAQRRLQFALNGNAKATERMIRLKDQLFKSTLFQEDDIMAAINMGLEMGRTEAQTRKLVQAAAGLAKVQGTDLVTATQALSATFEGNIGRLGKMAGDVKNLTDIQLRNGDAVDIINKKYGKFASEGLATTEGQLIQAKKWWGEFTEEIGYKFITLFQGIATGWSVITTIMGGGVDLKGNAEKQIEAIRAKIKQVNDETAALRQTQVGYMLTKEDEKEIEDKILGTKKDEKEIEDKILGTKKDQVKQQVLTYDELARYYQLLQTVGMLQKDISKISPMQPKSAAPLPGGLPQQPSITANLFDQRERELQSLRSSLKAGLVTYEQFEQQKKAINERYEEEILRNEISNLQASVAFLKSRGQDTMALEKQLAEARMNLDDAVTAKLKENADEAAAARQQSIEKTVTALNMFGQIAGDMFTIINANEKAAYDQQMQKVDERYQHESDAIDAMVKGKTITEEEGARRKEELDKKTRAEQARIDKEYRKEQQRRDLIQAVIQTALAVITELVRSSWVGAALAAVAGAAQIAVIASQKYAKGRQGGPAEYAIVGEEGTEGIRVGSKYYETPDTATLTYLPAGADVIPHKDWMNYWAVPTTKNADTRLHVTVDSPHSKAMLDEMRKKKTDTRIYTEGGYTVIEQGNYRQLTR